VQNFIPSRERKPRQTPYPSPVRCRRPLQHTGLPPGAWTSSRGHKPWGPGRPHPCDHNRLAGMGRHRSDARSGSSLHARSPCASLPAGDSSSCMDSKETSEIRFIHPWTQNRSLQWPRRSAPGHEVPWPKPAIPASGRQNCERSWSRQAPQRGFSAVRRWATPETLHRRILWRRARPFSDGHGPWGDGS